jgi:hypothetical protein
MCKIILLVMFIFSCASLAVVYSKDTTNQADDWEQYHDARLGFILEHPAGWTVQAQGYTILIQNAERSSLVMVEAFPVKPGETAKTRVSSISGLHPTLFPAARIDRIAQQPSQADQVVGALSYRNARGQSEQARVLCLVYQGSGMLYALSAPSDRFGNERATLLRILMSIRFGPTPDSHTATGGRSSARGGSTGANGSLRFVRWTEPREHAFSVEVPQGWTVDGGTYRFETSDIRPMTRVTSPDNDMMLQVGDQNLPMWLMPPSPSVMRTYPYAREGVPFSPNHTTQMMILRYMPAPEFNKWYLDKVLRQVVDEFSIVKETEMPEPSQRQTEAMSNQLGPRWQAQVTFARTDFKGRSKQTGKPIAGIIISRVAIQASRLDPSLPEISPIVGWSARPSIMICLADDRQEARQQMLLEIHTRINQSYQEDPAFVEKHNRQVAGDNAALAQRGAESIQRSKETTAAIARNAEATRQSIMGSYQAKNGAQGDFNGKFADYIGDKTGVTDPNTGQSYKVGSGYSNYYLDPRSNTIIGTNSANRPPVDFTVLTEY